MTRCRRERPRHVEDGEVVHRGHLQARPAERQVHVQPVDEVARSESPGPGHDAAHAV